jgi:hypothetical protein
MRDALWVALAAHNSPLPPAGASSLSVQTEIKFLTPSLPCLAPHVRHSISLGGQPCFALYIRYVYLLQRRPRALNESLAHPHFLWQLSPVDNRHTANPRLPGLDPMGYHARTECIKIGQTSQIFFSFEPLTYLSKSTPLCGHLTSRKVK